MRVLELLGLRQLLDPRARLVFERVWRDTEWILLDVRQSLVGIARGQWLGHLLDAGTR